MSYQDVVARNGRLKVGAPQLEQWLLRLILKAVGPVPLKLVIKGGPAISPPGVSPVATIVFHDRRSLMKVAVDPEVAFGEAFAAGRIEVEGDLTEALSAVYDSWSDRGQSWYGWLRWKWLELVQDNSRHGSRRNIHRHYDLGNEFYKLWLDSQLVYTCAYFPSPSATLEAAQEAKLDYVCRKLQLRAGERVVEAGCGWGALALHMAEHYGVSVTAYNISHEQIVHARRVAQERGLSGRVQFVEDDYRNISSGYDVFVSVGMLEHVGARHFRDLGEVIHRSIGDKGRGLLHFIGRSHTGEFSRWIRKRVFPGAYPPALTEAVNILQPHRYAVLDVENLRLHYAKTLEHWLQRFEEKGQQISEMYSAWFQRAWRLYLSGSLAGFRTGGLQLFQICFAGSKCMPLSWTRASLYAQDASCVEENTE